ncbi:gluconokinase [Nonlabens xiamenensis]|uniref:gluconokinase n=1 Tax=Nonlabens xiamenensis TaxID=2341043 RepID=UPI000F6087A6|nr:gluconokinase [Nonlabens xiamenensis]
MNRIVIIMGVSGVGKTTVGRQLAEEFDCPFQDADDFHPLSNIQKMKAGIALDDTDRWPWLESLNKYLRELKGASLILACSALKQSYRDHLAQGVDHLHWVFLQASVPLIQKRLESRKSHFFDPKLVRSQFETLEPPTDAIRIDAGQPLDQVVSHIKNELR